MNREKVLTKVTKNLRKSQACTLVVEEVSELIIELAKFSEMQGNYDELCEEVADVRIMTGLAMTTFGIKYSDVKKLKKKQDKPFKKFHKNKPDSYIIKSCIYELANFQKVICKKSRGRHNKKDILDAIVSIELSIEYIASKHFINEKDCEEWEKKKIHRMQKRIRKNQIV